MLFHEDIFHIVVLTFSISLSTAVLRYNSRTVLFTHFKSKDSLILGHSQHCITITVITLRTFSALQEENLLTSNHSQSLSSSQRKNRTCDNEKEGGMMQGRGHESKNLCRIRFEKDKETNSPLEPPEGNAALLTLGS